MRRCAFFAVLLWIVLLIGLCSVADADEAERVLLVYMLGGDLESQAGALTADLLEITRATGADAGLTVFLRVGGCETYRHPELTDGRGCCVRIQEGRMTVLETAAAGESMADPETLRAFVGRYGRDGASLIFWGHGCPGFEGIGFDETDGGKCLPLAGIRSALEEAGIRFRLIGFDACGMASFEAAATVAPFCSVFAASPLDESLGGWNYERLLPVLDRAEALRGEAQARNPLTVLDMDVFREGTGQFARVFGSCSSSAGLATLGDAARASGDAEAVAWVERYLDGQTLRLGVEAPTAADTAILGTGVGPAYLSFLERK